MAWTEHDHPDATVLASMLADTLAALCAAAIDRRGQALLALAGGRTPLPVYARLAAHALDWRRLIALPTDERCVPHADPACNLRALAAAFAQAGCTLESLTTRDGDPARSEVHAVTMLGRHVQDFDVVLLGMGGDGHIASLFPGAPQLASALDPATRADACRVDPRPLPRDAPYPRITLTLQRLLRARALHLLATGAAKREVLRRAQAEPDPGRHPVAALLHAPQALVHVHWSP